MSIEGFDNFEHIGEGGMAVVWKAHQMSLDRTVAIKVLKAELATDPEEVADFIQEAKAAAGLKHPNIIQVYDASEQEGIYFFVMEYIAGQTVDQVLEAGPIHWKKATLIASSIAEALEYAWDKFHLIHRDIKPGNIMFDDDGTVKLADMGLAKRMDTASLAEQIQVRKLEGTPNYMSPEQAKCKDKLDFRTDMYSLGATIYNMITGKVPFGEYEQMQALEMHINGYLINPRDLVPSIPLGVVQLMTKLMMKDPSDRFANWTEAVREIKKVAAGRILITKQGKMSDSTISQPEKKASDEMVGKRTPKNTDVPTPVAVWAPVWSILGIWWIYILWSICGMPPAPSLPKPFSPEIRKPVIAVAAAPAAKLTTANTKTNGQVATPPGATNTPPEVIPSAATNATPANPSSGNMQASDEESLLLHSLKSKLADSVMSQNPGEAATLIAQERQYTHSKSFEDEISKMEEFVSAISGKGQALETAMKKLVGKDTTIRVKGADWPIIIKSVQEDGKLLVDMKSKVGSAVVLRPATVQFSQLDPMDCIRWIGPADTESKCIAVFALSLKAKDYKLALKAAERCGPFAEIFKTKIEQEAPTLQPAAQPQ